MESLGGSLNQARAETALPSQPSFDPPHPAIITLVIVSQEVEQTVEREHFELGQLGMAGFASLPPRHASSDDYIAEKGIRDSGIGIRRKRQNVGQSVFSSVFAVQGPDPRIAHDGDTHGATRASGGDSSKPGGKAWHS